MPDYRAYVPVGRSLSLSGDGSVIAYASDASGQFNLWTQPVAGGPARQLTFFTDQSVREIAWAPDGSAIAFTADTCGDEQTQVYTVAAGGEPVRLSAAADRQHRIAAKTPFDPTGRYLFCGGNDRDPAVPDLIVYDLPRGSCLRFPGVPGMTVFPVAVSPDGCRLLAGAFGSNTEFQCYLADITTPGKPLELLTGHLPGSFFNPGPWSADGAGFFVRTTGDGDRVSLGYFHLADRTMTMVDKPGWDVENVAVSRDGSTVAWAVNDDGRSVLRARRDGVELDIPPIPDGVIEAMDLSADGTVAAILLDAPARPLAVGVVTLGPAQPIRYLTDTRPAAIRDGDPVTPELCEYPAADGTAIPALLYRPAGDGRHPVVVSIHGGPEQQARPCYDALYQCLLASGIGVFEPNVRGSSGYGHAWQTRIYRDWGGIDLDDFAAAAAYLHTLDQVQPDRLAVIGMSYGGFAALSCMSRLPDLWAAGVSICGPANLETLARSMPPDWAATVAAMIGNPDTEAGKLHQRSPVTYAEQIKAPLMVVQGANDPRVPKAEADQIVERVTANGVEVTYLVFDDEGHGFTSRDNDTRAHTAIAEFLVDHLLR